MGESSAVSCSAYDSNRNFTLQAHAAQDMTNISPMAGQEFNSNLQPHLSRFDRSEIHDNLQTNISQIMDSHSAYATNPCVNNT